MTLETALQALLSQGIIELQGDLLIIRLPGRTGEAKHSSLMHLIREKGWKGNLANPRPWAFLMGASILLSPRGRPDILVFLDASSKTLSTSTFKGPSCQHISHQNNGSRNKSNKPSNPFKRRENSTSPVM